MASGIPTRVASPAIQLLIDRSLTFIFIFSTINIVHIAITRHSHLAYYSNVGAPCAIDIRMLRLSGSCAHPSLYPPAHACTCSIQVMRIASVVIGAVVIVLALIILIFAYFVNNATRGRVYRGDRCLMGGRFSATMVRTFVARACMCVCRLRSDSVSIVQFFGG